MLLFLFVADAEPNNRLVVGGTIMEKSCLEKTEEEEEEASGAKLAEISVVKVVAKMAETSVAMMRLMVAPPEPVVEKIVWAMRESEPAEIGWVKMVEAIA